MRLDLGAIAKGYATDEALKELAALGIERALINASGGMSIGLAPPGETGWKVGVAPLDMTEEPRQLLLLQECSVATSGDAWQYVEIDGRRYSHILDPRTGIGLTTRSSATVISKNGLIADGLSTAVCVLGPEKGLELIEKTPGACALIMELVDGHTRVHQSSGFSQIPTVERRAGLNTGVRDVRDH
jgi:thiamine biosynthesis lipoprotein